MEGGFGVARVGRRIFIYFGRPSQKSIKKTQMNTLKTKVWGRGRKEIISMDQGSLGIEKQSF